MLDRRRELFLRRLVQRSIDDFNSVSGATVVFFDRGLPDCVAYAAVFGLDPGSVLEQASAFRYDSPVFIAPPWKEIYTRDALRRATFQQVEAFHVHLRSAYLRLGYELIELPRTSPRGRVEAIAEHLHLEPPFPEPIGRRTRSEAGERRPRDRHLPIDGPAGLGDNGRATPTNSVGIAPERAATAANHR